MSKGSPFTRPILDILGDIADAAASGASDGTDTAMALIRAIYDSVAGTAGGDILFGGAVTSGGSATAIGIDSLSGMGDDRFTGSHYYMFVARTTDDAAPLAEWRAITDYDDDGTFTVTAFSAVATAEDYMVIVHESIYWAYVNRFLMGVADGTGAFPASVVDNSVMADIMTSDGDASGYNRATDSLEALSTAIDALPITSEVNAEVVDVVNTDGKLDHLIAVADGGTTAPTQPVDNSILGLILTKQSGGDISDFDNSTDSLEAISDRMLDTGTNTFNATALQSIQDECEDSLEGEYLDHFLQLDGATQKYPENCATDSILSKILVKADPAVPSAFDNSTDSLEAIADAVGVVDGFQDVPTKDATTDAQMRDVIGKKDDTAVTTAGTQNSLVGYAKGLLTNVALIPTTAMRGTDSAFLAAVGGALNDAAAAGDVTDTDTMMAYVKQLVTLLLLVPTTAMRGTDNAALASDMGTAADDHADATLFGWVDKTYDMASAAHDDAATAAGHANPDPAGTAAGLIAALNNLSTGDVDGVITANATVVAMAGVIAALPDGGALTTLLADAATAAAGPATFEDAANRLAENFTTVASANLKHSNNTDTVINVTDYAFAKEIIIRRDMAAARVKFTLYGGLDTTTWCKIYKNGVAIGTERSSSAPPMTPDTFSEDFAGFVAGDHIELYAKYSQGTPGGHITDFGIYYDFTIETNAATAAAFAGVAKTAELISGAAVDFGAAAKVSLQAAAQAAITASSLALASNCDAKVSEVHKQTAGTGDGAGTIGKILFDLNVNVDAKISDVKAKTDLILPGTKFATKTSTTHLTSGDLFSFTGSVGIVSIIGRVTTALEAATPQTIKLTCTPDALSATDLCATKDANAFAVGSLLTITGTLADAMIGATGVGCAVSQASMITCTCVTSGKISVVFGTSGSKDGEIVWEVFWTPLTPSATLVAA